MAGKEQSRKKPNAMSRKSPTRPQRVGPRQTHSLQYRTASLEGAAAENGFMGWTWNKVTIVPSGPRSCCGDGAVWATPQNGTIAGPTSNDEDTEDSQCTRVAAARGLKISDYGQTFGDIHSLRMTEFGHSVITSFACGVGEVTYLLRLITDQIYSVSHALWTRKPPHDTWPLYFHVLMAILRSSLRRPDLSIPRIRLQTSLLYSPVPLCVNITTVRIDVRRAELLAPERETMKARNARGFATVPAETGKNSHQPVYRLTGEWVDYHTKRGPPLSKKVILYLHGGGYVIGSAKTHRGFTYRASKMTGARVFVVNYRLAPDDPFPAAVHDAFAAYLYLTAPDHPAVSAGQNSKVHRPYKPRNVIVMGDSAGGGLSMALMIYLRDYVSSTKRFAFGMVGGAMLMSPWVDLLCASESWHSNSQYDYLPVHPGSMDGVFNTEVSPTRMYLLGKQPLPKCASANGMYGSWSNIEFLARHPLASSIYADMIKLPPMLIQAGGLEFLRDECRLLAYRASTSGVLVRFELFKDMTHVWQAFPFLPAAKIAYARQRDFFLSKLENNHRQRQHFPAKGTASARPAHQAGSTSEWFVFDHNCEVSPEPVEATEAAAVAVIKLLLLGTGQHASEEQILAGSLSWPADHLKRGDSGVVDTDATATAAGKDGHEVSQLQTAVDGADSKEGFRYVVDEERDSEEDDEVEQNAIVLGPLEAAELELMKPKRRNLLITIAETPLGVLASAAMSAVADTEARCLIGKELVEEGDRGIIRDVEFDKAIDEFVMATNAITI